MYKLEFVTAGNNIQKTGKLKLPQGSLALRLQKGQLLLQPKHLGIA